MLKEPTPQEIKEARLSAGLTQTQAAELAMVKLRAWQRYEAGEYSPKPASWALFCARVGIDPDNPEK